MEKNRVQIRTLLRKTAREYIITINLIIIESESEDERGKSKEKCIKETRRRRISIIKVNQSIEMN